MLAELRIRNFAIIDQIGLEFAPGLNVLSGETGAGKTIVMSALGLLLGMRASPDMVRTESREAAVEGRFELEGEELAAEIGELAALDGGQELIIRRTVAEGGRSRAIVNDSMATVGTLSRIGSTLVEVYGQHEQQSLLRVENHLAILDRFAGLETLKADYRAVYDRAQKQIAGLADLERRVSERERRLELLRFELVELDRAELSPDEDKELAAQRAILANAAKLGAAVSAAEAAIASQDSSAVELVGHARAALADAAAIDPKLGEPAELIEAARVSLQEAAHLLQLYAARIEADPARLDQIETRLQELTRIKRKYGGSIESALAARERAQAEIAEIEDVEGGLERLRAAAREAIAEAARIARELSRSRQAAAGQLKREMETELKTLGMRNAIFQMRLVAIKAGEGAMEYEGMGLAPDGADQGEFQIAPNLGQPPMALARIASGGELSRVMLALKRLEARRRGVATMIFDEVDAGIGGAIAEVVGRKLKELARFHQILCITHLPQIASFADRHFVVEKREAGGTTTSRVTQLDQTQRIEELARMLGGAQISDRFRRAARELLQRAQA